MYNAFNTASLSKLSRQELLSLLAELHGKFNASTGDAERDMIHIKIEAVKRALTL